MTKKFLTQIDVPELVTGNLSISPSGITSTQASDDILITPTGLGALRVENRITLENVLSFGPLDPQGSYMAVNAEYLQSGILSAWKYLQNGPAIKYEFDNDGMLTIFTTPAGMAGDMIFDWTQVFQIPYSGIIEGTYGGTGTDNTNSTLAITGNASISGSNTGDQIITLTGDITGSGTGSFATTLGNSGVTAGVYGNATQVPQITFDSKGRATLASNVTVNDTSKLPLAGGTLSGNVTFSGAQPWPTFNQNTTGNAATATALQTPRAINGVNFDGTGNITVTANTSNVLTIAGPLTGTSFNGGTATTIGLPTANSTITGALSATDWATFNSKQAVLSGLGLVKSTNGTITYLTDNSANWNTAYDRSLTSAAVTGTTTKTLTLNKQDGTNITATWSDLNTDAVTSVFGRTGAITATEGDYSLTQLSDVTVATPSSGQLLQNNGTQWVNWTPNYLTGNQNITVTGDATGSGATAITLTLANSGATAGIYGNATQSAQVTVDAKGRITTATNVTITPAFSSITSKPTTVSGYGITDAATLTGTETLTNKTVTDASFTIQDDADNTKKAKVDASGITTATTRTYTLPNVNGTLVSTGDTGTVTNTMLAGSIADTKLNTITTAGKVSNSATTATNANTSLAIVSRDSTGNFSANTITANLTGNANTATTLSADTADLYTNVLPANNGVTDTYIYVGRWTTTQTYEKLDVSIIYQNLNASQDSRRVAEYRFLIGTSNGVNFTAGSTGNFYGWGRGFNTNEGGAIASAGTLLVQVSNTVYDLYILSPGNLSTGPAVYKINLSGGSWTHAGTVYGATAPTGNAIILYIDDILTNYSFPTFYSVTSLGTITSLGQVAINSTYSDATDGGALAFINSTANRIDFNTAGTGLPTVSTRSQGTKIAFRQTIGASTLDFGVGVSSNTQWYSVQDTSSFHSFYTGANVALRLGNAGTSSRGAVYQGNSAITTLNATSTLTIAQLLTLVIQSTPTANITFTLPTGTLTDAGVLASLETYRSFTWSVVNLAGFTITMGGGTGHTYVGNATIAANTSASFRTIKTAANTFTTYRI
jgi:hypothetical protein